MAGKSPIEAVDTWEGEGQIKGKEGRLNITGLLMDERLK